MAVLESLALEAQPLSSLARALGLSTATAHAILTTLREAGWVERDAETRRFSLGPVFLELAQQVAPRGVPVAVRLDELAAELGMPVSLSAKRSRALQVVMAAAPAGTRAPAVGEEVPYAVPFGPVLAAFDSPSEQARWLNGSGQLRADVLESLDERLALIRDRGYSVERLGPSALRLVEVLHDVRVDGSSTSMEPIMQALLSEIVQSGLTPASGRQPVTVIAVPVRTAAGAVTQTLNAHPFRTMSPSAAVGVAKRLVAEAARLQEGPS